MDLIVFAFYFLRDIIHHLGRNNSFKRREKICAKIILRIFSAYIIKREVTFLKKKLLFVIPFLMVAMLIFTACGENNNNENTDNTQDDSNVEISTDDTKTSDDTENQDDNSDESTNDGESLENKETDKDKESDIEKSDDLSNSESNKASSEK